MTSPSEQTLLITGANGFLAGHVIKEALEQGYDIRGTVRSPESAKEVRDLFAEYAEDSHVAAPFTLKVEDNCSQLLDPAIQGAIAMLEAVNPYGPSAQRVVTTSSITAIIDLSKGF
ncbi:hypothetical protein J3E69DRAFT_372374 [Trichoderma sp. SZMC 28015]